MFAVFLFFNLLSQALPTYIVHRYLSYVLRFTDLVSDFLPKKSFFQNGQTSFTTPKTDQYCLRPQATLHFFKERFIAKLGRSQRFTHKVFYEERCQNSFEIHLPIYSAYGLFKTNVFLRSFEFLSLCDFNSFLKLFIKRFSMKVFFENRI